MPKPDRPKDPKHFWRFAKRLLRYRLTIAAAMAFAAVSALGLGVGIIGIVGAVELVADKDAQTLAQLIATNTASFPEALQPPQAWLDALPESRWSSLVSLVSILGLLTVVGAAANFFHVYLAMTACTYTIADIRKDAYDAVLRTPLLGVPARDPSDTISRVMSDTTILNRGFRALTSKAVAQISKGATALIAAIIIDWLTAVITLVAAPLVATVIRKLGKQIRRASRGAMKGRAELLGYVNESLHGFRVVKVYGAEQRELERFDKQNRSVIRQELRARTARALSAPLLELIAIVILGTLALVAGKAIIDGNLAIGEAVGVLGGLAYAASSLKPLSNVVQDIQTAAAAAERVHAITSAAPEATHPENAKPLPRLTTAITFENVSFTYPKKDAPALADLSLTIPANATTAVVGPNGCGKTTLLSLVPALIRPSKGRILIDGQDLAETDLASLRQQIGVVTQDTVLFRGTIADNIAYANPDASRDELTHAIQRAHADFVFELPKGIDTQVGERGQSLSGGQRQRLAIARAILRDPAILIMDEATSMIDADSEAKITAALAEFGSTRTVLTVAHRLSTVIHADTIVVMDNGTIAATGTHDDLLKTSPLYASLAKHQLAQAPTQTTA